MIEKRYAAALLTKNGKVLLGKRAAARKSYPGSWDILGGHCKKNESFEAAMLREIKEETGVKPFEYQLMRMVEVPGDFIMAVYHVTAWSGKIYNAELSEHDEIQWHDIDKALKLEFPESEYLSLLTQVKNQMVPAPFSHRIFLIDGAGALISAGLMKYLIAPFQEWFGMPSSVAHALAVIAILFSIYSIACYFFRVKRWAVLLKIIASLNMLYCLLVFASVVYFFSSVTTLGVVYFLGEIVIIMLLALWEFRFSDK